ADLTRVSSVRLPEEPPCPEVPAGHRPVFLLDAATGLEDRLLRAWLGRCPGMSDARVFNLAPSRIRRRSRRTDLALGEALSADGANWLVPLRVVWMPSERFGRRTVSWIDVIKLGDPRDPRWLRDYLIVAFFPDRVRIVVAAGASGEDLARRHKESGEHANRLDFVTRQAWLALDRAEREERGNRYKIPRFVAEDIINGPRFQERVIEIGRERGLESSRALSRARRYLAEIAATHSPFLIDLIANLIHWVIRQGYGAIHYDRAFVRRIARLGSDYPVVFLPSHKSNLDRLSLQFMLWENDLPPNHTAGGINMNFFPIGPLVRRTGVFFIRRTFKDNDLYKYVVRTYIDYLIEKRFPLEWYMEGGRSRTGKLRPPRYGLLSWVADSYRRGKAEDVYLLPISIAYDQIQEVGAYVAEATGGSKEHESFSWAWKFSRNLRRRYGDIHIRFADPVSLAAEVEGADLEDENPIEVQKLAFEVMYRISMVTPITPTALLATVLLAANGEARDVAAIAEGCRMLVAYAERRDLPTTAPLPTDPDRVVAALGLMMEHRLLASVTADDSTVYWMDEEHKLRSSYYANTVVHFFVPRGLAEIAMSASDLDSFWTDIYDLRDLLKFEFFFADRDEFRKGLLSELTSEVPDWEERVAAGAGDQVELSPSTAGFAVLPLLEAYQVVADELASLKGPVDEKQFPAACLTRGRLYRLEGRTFSDQSVSQAVYGGALLLARNRGLTGDAPGVAERRAGFAQEVIRFREGAARLGGESPASRSVL
ncbi:MAG TPA: 1-acyl-sn-glycerol-3-phosphate acyltransferase, partial [Acidimicrobiia bacterium]|nr:1-acyl-sn-glycerol-3-phosphate acyltransferase [Acidimicrobiia bacterium]